KNDKSACGSCLFAIGQVVNKRVYPQIPSKCLKWWLKLLLNLKLVLPLSYHDLSYICVSLSQYLKFVGKLFCSILYTYNSVFCTPVPQSLVCDTSAMGVNSF